MDAVAASRRPVRKVRTNSRQAMSKSCAGRRAAPAGGLRQTTYCCAAPANLFCGSERSAGTVWWKGFPELRHCRGS